ncbi:hypothetical protein TNCT_202501 [Trichonephila clavata]|uniref:Uncharacterized protein n=1 Tax=Trichonephila clavata TaxID=2740835 RepID=A0A8X6KGX5_TRICU|nr:hypothetical protein TNCT_202501 [Trichonephila clavata]
MTPGMDPQSGLWNCAISALVQRSSGEQLLGSDLYQELRLKEKISFRSRDGLSRGEFFTRISLYFQWMAVVIDISLSIEKAILNLCSL